LLRWLMFIMVWTATSHFALEIMCLHAFCCNKLGTLYDLIIFIIVLFVETPHKFITASNTFTWCFHEQSYYMFYRHANLQRILINSFYWWAFGNWTCRLYID
jgi:hypothetical protein